MAGKSLRRGMRRPLVVVSAAMVVLTPSIAYATPLVVTVLVPSATAGPNSGLTEVVSAAGPCASGSYVSGGGIDQALGTAPNGVHVNGTEPSANGSTEPLGGTPPQTNVNPINNATYWLGIGGSGGMSGTGNSTTAYAMCFASAVITGTEVIVSSIASDNLVVATCPSGTKLLGGGGRATPASTGSMKVIASYPTFINTPGYDSGKLAAKDTNLDPDSWAAVGNNGGMSGSLDTYAFAICGTGSGMAFNNAHVYVAFHEESGPTTASSGKTSTVGCGTNGTLLSGGAAIAGANVTTTDFTVPGSQGDHLNGSYPSDSSANPVTNSTTTAASWTAWGHTGGMASPAGTVTDAWALCGQNM